MSDQDQPLTDMNAGGQAWARDRTPPRRIRRFPTEVEQNWRAPPRYRGRKSKYWCFTLNNYDEGDINQLRNLMDSGTLVSYVVFGREVGENGTPHLQGYVEFKTRWDLVRCTRSFLPRAHFEQRRGTPQEAADYCKKDGDWEQSGEISTGIIGLPPRTINNN